MTSRILPLVCLYCLSLREATVSGFSFIATTSSVSLPRQLQGVAINSSSNAKTSTVLFAASDDDKKKATLKNYSRPSAAIERGSGFFFPGLEGPRVRLLFGVVLLLLTFVNRITSPTTISTLSFEEIIAISYSLLVLFQAVIEFGKEELIVEGDGKTNNVSSKKQQQQQQEDLVQQWTTAIDLDDDFQSKVSWAAASYLSVTPASQIMLLSKVKKEMNVIVYRLGGKQIQPDKDNNDETESQGIDAALKQLSQSKGGRLSLPLTHPAAIALCPDTTNDNIRTIVLQRITNDSCLMMTSDQLLASFTPADLKWLGQMGSYLQSTLQEKENQLE